MICFIKHSYWIALHQHHTVKASKPILMRFQACLSPRSKPNWLMASTTSLEAGTIRILRPITLSISALLLSKTSVWEPRNWYYNHSLMSHNQSRKIRVILKQHRARLLQSDVTYVCIGYICLHAPGLMLMDIWENYLETLKSYANVGFILEKSIYWVPQRASKKVIKENDVADSYDDSFWCVWNMQG